MGSLLLYDSASAARQLDPTVVSVQIHLLELVVLSMRVGNPSFFAPLNRAVVAVYLYTSLENGSRASNDPHGRSASVRQGVLSDLAYCLLGHSHLLLQGALNPAVAGTPRL